MFAGDGPAPGPLAFAERAQDRLTSPAGPVPAAPLLQRLRDLKALVEAPEVRARQLAFVIARNRAPLTTPGFGRRMPPRIGTEVTTLFGAMGASLTRAIQARPPPRFAAPWPPPRMRVL